MVCMTNIFLPAKCKTLLISIIALQESNSEKTGEITLRSQEQAKIHAKTIGPIVQKRLLKMLDNVDKDLKKLETAKKNK